MKKYLISYGDDNYQQQRIYLKKTAEASGFFDEIRVFTPEDIDAEYVTKMQHVLQHRKGGGYWIWKPWLIRTTLSKLQEGDILIYCDAGCLINPNGKERFTKYIQMLNLSETGTIDFVLPHKEYEYTKQDVFDYFKSSDAIIDSDQIMATIILIRKCPHSELLVHKWFETACNASFLFTDEQRTFPHHGFIDHRHDQSVFSVIRKTFGANKIPDETYFKDFLKEGMGYPLWATRIRC